MALSIVNNSTAIGAQGNVTTANNNLTKTIEALSTGLRINSAADDPSGLAVSEKLRAQISGLEQAATNAQDAISLLQTAEGAMGSMTDLLQRVRELAVQAGDAAYTANDRAMLQLEVDQLLEEIDRISTTTEFNTKKLLNGDAAAIWSASTDSIEAIITGTVAEGNYQISYTVDPGTNSVYKSNVMTIAEGEISYDINSNGTAITKIDNMSNMVSEDNVTITVSSIDITDYATGEEAVTDDSTYLQDMSNNGVTLSASDTKEVYVGSVNGVSKVDWESVNSAQVTINGTTYTSGSHEIEVNGVTLSFTVTEATNNAYITINATTGLYQTFTANTTLSDTDLVLINTGSTTAGIIGYTGDNGDVVDTDSLEELKTLGTNYLEIQVLSDAYDSEGNAQGFQIQIRTRNASTGELSEWIEVSINTAGETVGNTDFFSAGTQLFDMGVSTDALKEGDTILAQVSSGLLTTAGDVASDVSAGITSYAAVQIDENGATVVVADLTSTEASNTTTFYTAQMDTSGNVYYGQMDITFAQGSIVSGTASIDILTEGDIASTYTKLSQIAEFTNSDGVMILDNTRELTIYGGNGETATITLEGSDTIADLLSKLNSAILDQLGMGASGSDVSTINSNLAQYVEEGDETSTGANAVAGTFVLQGAILGSDSNLTFVGDESLLNALGLTQIQEAADSEIHVWVQDAHTGAWVGEDTITDGRLRNVIQGVDIDITPESAANISYDESTGYLSFTPSGETSVAYLHVKDNSTVAAIGANEGQTIDLSIAQLDTTSLEISGITVATIDDAQSALTKIDIALETLSAARATVGAQINRLEYTITNLDTTRENLTASESRIRDLDIATASTDLASQQVILQSATAMLAQANTIPSYALMLLS